MDRGGRETDEDDATSRIVKMFEFGKVGDVENRKLSG